MPFSLDIVPHVPSLDMYGSTRSGSAYSLSGEIVLTLTSPTPSLFGSQSAGPSGSNSSSKPTTIYLASLLVTFEGRVEILSQNCGYVPYRLCSVEKDLVAALDGGLTKPIALTNRGAKNGVMRWSMTFDLSVPGWLPPSVSLDEQGSGTTYSLHAAARFADDFDTALQAAATPATSLPTTVTLSGSSSGSSGSAASSFFPAVSGLSLSALNPFGRSKVRTSTAAHVPIKVNRFRSPKALNPFTGVGAPDVAAPLLPPQIYHPTPSMFPVTLESVETRVNVPNKHGKDNQDGKRIPLEYLSNIEVVAGVPEYVGMGEDKVPLSLRVRSTNGDAINKGLVLEAFDVEVEQVEKFRSVPCERFLSSYPLPPSSMQPPIKPFLTQNPMEGFFNLGLTAPPEPLQWTRTVPMLPTKRVNFRPSPATGGLELDGEWAKMDLAISVLRKGDQELELPIPTPDDDKDDEKSGRNLRRKLLNPDFDTPFCKVRHEMKIALRLSWLPDAAAAEIAAQCGSDSANAGERLRKARIAHPDRKTETLVMTLPMKLVQVSECVEDLYKMLGVHHGASSAAMRRTTAQSRSASPVPSLSSSTSSGSDSSRSSPASGVLALPSVSSPHSSRSASPAPSTSSSCSSASSMDGLTPYSKAVHGAFLLPPYSELYDSNGERKELTEGVWLPPYMEKDDSSALPMFSLAV